MNKENKVVTLVLGPLLICVALFAPSRELLDFFGATSGSRLEQVTMGITLLRICVVILGALIIVSSRLSIWQPSIRANDAMTRGPVVILAAILSVAAVLRLFGLNDGLWHDEILTHVKFATMPFGEILSTYDSQNQNFSYSLLAHASFILFGESAFALRLPAVVFGVASIWAIYFLGREVANVRESLLTAALLTVSYHHIWFSQNARGYTGLLFWTLLASGLFLKAVREHRPKLWLMYAASSALGVYTQMTMVFVIISHFTAYMSTVLYRPKGTFSERWNGLLLGFGLTGFFVLLLHAVVLPQILETVVGQQSTVPAWKNPLWTIFEIMQGISVGFVHGAGAIVALGIFGLGLWSYSRTNGVLLQFLFVPPILCAAVNIAMGHHLWPRFFFFTFGFAALVVVRGTMLLGGILAPIWGLKPAKGLAVGTALCSGLILLSAISAGSAYAPKQDFKGALDFVLSRSEPGDAVLTVGLATFTYQNLYKVNWGSVDSLDGLNAIRARAKRTWLLYTFPTHVAAVYPDIMSTIQTDFKIIKRFPGTVGDGTVFVSRFNGDRS